MGAPDEVLVDAAPRAHDRPRDAVPGEAPVRDDAEPAQAEQVGAALTLGIDLLAELSQPRPQQHAADTPAGRCGGDVVVTDGFTGNIALKVMEGVSQATIGAVRGAAKASPVAAAGGLLLRPSVQRLRDEIDPEGPGGAYMLGLRKVGVVAHGRFTRRGFSRAIEVAARAVQEDVIGRTRAALQEAGALRAVGGDGLPDGSGGSSEHVGTFSGQ